MTSLRVSAALAAALFLSLVPAKADDFRLLVLDHGFVKWGDPQLGTGAMVTYAFATENADNPDARNCKHLTPFADLAAASKLPLPTLEGEAHAAFANWERVSALRFEPAARPEDANILIGVQADSPGLAFTNVEPRKPALLSRVARAINNWLGLSATGATRINTIKQALICLNSKQVWKIGFDGNLKTYDVRYALTHEIGHAIGLDHPGAAGALMGFRYTEKFRDLQAGDIAAVQALYGKGVGNSE